MTIGEMKDRITVHHINKLDNGRGGFLRKEMPIGTFWGQIESLRDAKLVQYRQADLNSNTRITMRIDSRITRNCVLFARGYRYEIEEVIEEGNFLKILAVGEKIGE